MGADISLTGISDLVDELSRWDGNADAVVDVALRAAAQPILSEAKQSTAFSDRSGKLRSSLKLSKVKQKKYKYKYIQIFTKSPHAHLVEFGHSGYTAKAHPFLDPAFEHHKSEAQDIIAQKLREALA